MAATVKARARKLLRDAGELLGERTLPKGVRESLEGLQGALKRTWQDLEQEAADDGEDPGSAGEGAEGQATTEADLTPSPSPTGRGERALREARNVGQWFEAEIHRSFTVMADNAFGEGQLTREERIALSNAIGSALDAFTARLTQIAPGLYQRDPYQAAPAPVWAMPMGEAADVAELVGEMVPLLEGAAALREGAKGLSRVRVIKPGWGSSGYYPAEVLERDGPSVLKAGTQMFWDHPTIAEEAERPEGSLRNLAGHLVSDAVYEPAGPAGPGLYADVRISGGFQEAVSDLVNEIGLSIRGAGKVKRGTAEGRSGPIVERLAGVRSVDFVTKAGAGGQVVQLFEAARDHDLHDLPDARDDDGDPDPGLQEGARMEKVEELEGQMRQLQEANARLQEALILREAREVVSETLAGIEMPALTRARLLESLAGRPVLKESALDREATVAAVRQAAEAELKYLAEAAGMGRVTGMGSGASGGANPAQSAAKLEEALRGMGLSETAAKAAAGGR
jgi:hypothetical protein